MTSAAPPTLTQAALAERPSEMLPFLEAAMRDDPANVTATRNVGIMLNRLGRQQEAEAVLRRALALDGEDGGNQFALAQCLLGQGRFHEAWPLYAARDRAGGITPTGIPTGMQLPKWRGEPLAGKRIAILPEQGLGDQIQFARFIPQLIAVGAAVTILANPALAELFRTSFPAASIVVAQGQVKFPAADCWATMGDLPIALDAAPETFSKPPYLVTGQKWSAPPAGFKVGLMTSGNPSHVNDRRRSLTPEQADALRARLPGTIIDLDPRRSGVADFAQTAALVNELDLVVSVDTSVSHLAGALGKPCLLLLPGFNTDWRWMRGRDDSPWYPTHRLYRGGIDDGWDAAIDRLVEDAQALAAASAGGGASPAHAPMLEGVRLVEAGRYGEAEEAYRAALAADPRYPSALHNLGSLLADLGRLEEGEGYQRRAVVLTPHHAQFRLGLATTLLAMGRYVEAWPLYKARIDVPTVKSGYPRHLVFAHWQGEALVGKSIAVFPEQGLGDDIQNVRFVPWLRRQADRVVLLTRPSLARLFADSFPEVEVRPIDGDIMQLGCDYWVTTAELPGLAGARTDTLPAPPYLSAPDAPARPRGFRVGVMARGNPRYDRDAARSLDAAAEDALRSALPGEVISLHPDDTGAKDFADTARIIAGLDLVVTVDTSVAHLAGALGKRCFLLLPGFATDWRWMRGRDDSPWYPNHRLYRRAIGEGWEEAIERIATDAHALAGDVALASPAA